MESGQDISTNNLSNKNNLISLDILNLLSSYQSQNGIRAKDYERYIHFCSKKINKLRKKFNLTQGKRKFNRIDINAENTTNSKILLIMILETDRNWAIGALYNQKLTSMDAVVSKWKYKAKEKYLRSCNFAQKLVELCKQTCDDLTICEANAYSQFLKGNYLTYIRKYSEALNEYKQSKDNYNQIISNKDSIESLVYKDKIKFVIMQIRLCEYNLSKTINSNDNKNNENELRIGDEDDQEDIEDENKTKILNNKNIENNMDNYSIFYQSTSIPIKNQNLRVKLVKIDEMVTKIKLEQQISKKQNYFSDLFNLLDDASKIIKTEKQEKSKDNDNYTHIYNKLLNYISYSKICYQIWKTNLYIIEYQDEYFIKNKNLIVDLLEKDNYKFIVKPQEMIKLYDNLLQYYFQIRSNEKDNTNENFFKEITLKENIVNAAKCLFSSVYYISIKKYEDSLILLKRFLKMKDEINNFYVIHNLDKFNINNISSNKASIENEKINFSDTNIMISTITNELSNYAEFCYKKVLVKIKLDDIKNITQSNINNNIDKVKKNEKLNFKCQSWLQNDIKLEKDSINKETYSLFSENLKMEYDEFQAAIKKQNYNNYTNLIQFPPNFQLLTPRPISYDLIHSSFQYPDLTHKFKKEEKKGIIGRAFGYMFGK